MCSNNFNWDTRIQIGNKKTWESLFRTLSDGPGRAGATAVGAAEGFGLRHGGTNKKDLQGGLRPQET